MPAPIGALTVLGVLSLPPVRGRLAHLTRRVPRELVENARSLAGGLPDIDMRDVLAAKVGGRRPYPLRARARPHHDTRRVL